MAATQPSAAVNIELTKDDIRNLLKGLTVLEAQAERSLAKEDTGGEIYNLRKVQIANIRRLAAHLQTKEL